MLRVGRLSSPSGQQSLSGVTETPLKAEFKEFDSAADRGSLLDPVPQRLSGLVDAVVANVPYVPPERRNTSWDFAPGAIGGSGADGLGLVRDLAAAARRFLRPGGSLILQMTGGQWTHFADELAELGYRDGGILGGSGADIVVGARFEERAREVAIP